MADAYTLETAAKLLRRERTTAGNAQPISALCDAVVLLLLHEAEKAAKHTSQDNRE
jgi:hypothetical protein